MLLLFGTEFGLRYTILWRRTSLVQGASVGFTAKTPRIARLQRITVTEIGELELLQK